MRHPAALTLKQLRALTAVLREGGVVAAAEALHVTPPAISTQLRNLEGNLGAPALERDAEGRYRPSEAGAALLEAATRIEAALARAADQIEALGQGLSGRVTLGVVSTGKYIAPRLVALARAALPGVDVRLLVGNRGEIMQMLSADALDLAIMGRPPRDPPVEATPLGPHPHLLIAPPDHPLAGGKSIAPQALNDEVFLLREPGSGTRILAERWLLNLDQTPKVAVFDSNETIKQAVMAGLGVALISGHTIGAELRHGDLAALDVRGVPVMRTWFLVRRRDAPLTAASEKMAAFLSEGVGRFPPG